MSRMVVIIQARVGSTRLPRKVLLTLGDRTVLARVLARVGACQKVDEIVVATTDQESDDPIEAEVTRLGLSCFRGSETDVLARYHGAAQSVDAEHVIRITSDCPLIDPQLIDQMIDRYHALGSAVDYMSNALPRTFAHGLDTEIFSTKSLATAYNEASDPMHREHVTPFFYTQPDRFSLFGYTQDLDHSHLRWTLDEPSDWEFFKAIVARLPDPMVPVSEVLDLLKRDPQLTQLNTHVQQKRWWDGTESTTKRVA